MSLTDVTQHRSRPESEPSAPEEANNRTAGAGNVEPHAYLDHLLQLRQIDCDAVWQAVDIEGRLVSALWFCSSSSV
jgi:hypothetical protein